MTTSGCKTWKPNSNVAFEVRLSRDAADYLRRVAAPTRERLLRRLRELADDPFARSKPLTNAEGRRSSRVGALRIILTVDTDGQIVAVSHIGPRGQVYRRG